MSCVIVRVFLSLILAWVLLVLSTLSGYPHVSLTSWLITGAIIAVSLVIGITWPITYACSLRYALEGTTLRVEEGFLFRKQKSIPLDRVTDLELVQGPLMRLFGLWKLCVQTAGSAQQRPEGVLHGLAEPHLIRDVIMKARDRAARGANDPG
jgi:membrane protein YdbS with pleckstrin-like domain